MNYGEIPPYKKPSERVHITSGHEQKIVNPCAGVKTIIKTAN